MPVTDWKPARFVVSTTGYGNYNTSAETIYNSIANGQAWSNPIYTSGPRKQFVGNYVQVSNSGNLNATLNGSTGFTIGAWVAMDNYSATQGQVPIFYRGTQAAFDRVAFGRLAGNAYAVIDNNGVGIGYGFASADEVYRGLRYWCMVYSGGGATDADRLKVYTVSKTGEVKSLAISFGAAIPSTAPTSASDAQIGNWEPGAGYPAYGQIGHLQVINRPMASGEIADNALSPSPSLPGTVAYWSMSNPRDEPDLSGNSNAVHGMGVTFKYASDAQDATVDFGSVTAGNGVSSKWLDGSDFDFGIPTNYIIDQIDTRVKLDVGSIGGGEVHIDNVIRLQDYYHPRYSGGHDAYSSTISGDYYMVSLTPAPTPMTVRCFDGVDDYGYIPSGSAINGTDKLTVATWLYNDSVSDVPVFAKGEQGVGTIWYKVTDYLGGYMGTGNFSFPNGGLLQPGWNFAAVVYDGTAAQALRLKSYINGAESTASEGIPATIPTHIDDIQVARGLIGDPASESFGNTKLSHYHIYTGVLSAAEIEQVRADPSGGYTTNLWAYYKMTGTGTWEHDYSNSGHHMEISGASSCRVSYTQGMPVQLFGSFNNMVDPDIGSLSYSRVNQANFGMAYAVRISGSTTANRTVGVDSMEMRVWYSTPTGGLPLYTYGLDSQSSGLPLLVAGYGTSSGSTPLYVAGNTSAAQGMNLFLNSHPFSSSAGLNQGVKAPTSKIRCFDGADDYGYIPSGSALNGTNKLTVATWFYSSGPSTFPVFIKGEQGVGTTWYKYNDSTDNRLAGYMGTGNFSFPNGGLLQSGWNFAAVVYDGTAAQALRLKSYINGAESTASEGIPASIPTHTDDIQVVKGRVGNPLATEIGNTRLSHYHIYTGVLSAAQVEQVRTEPLSYTTDLWAYYKMIGTGTWEHDYSNNGRHMQISGASSCNLSEVNYNLGMPGAIFEQFNIMPMYLTAVTGIDGFRAATGMNMYVQVANPTGWLSMPLHTYSAHLATGGMPLVIPSSIGQSTKGVTLFSAGY